LVPVPGRAGELSRSESQRAAGLTWCSGVRPRTPPLGQSTHAGRGPANCPLQVSPRPRPRRSGALRPVGRCVADQAVPWSGGRRCPAIRISLAGPSERTRTSSEGAAYRADGLPSRPTLIRSALSQDGIHSPTDRSVAILERVRAAPPRHSRWSVPLPDREATATRPPDSRGNRSGSGPGHRSPPASPALGCTTKPQPCFFL
jgi:hypothetical protein